MDGLLLLVLSGEAGAGRVGTGVAWCCGGLGRKGVENPGRRRGLRRRKVNSVVEADSLRERTPVNLMQRGAGGGVQSKEVAS